MPVHEFSKFSVPQNYPGGLLGSFLGAGLRVCPSVAFTVEPKILDF